MSDSENEDKLIVLQPEVKKRRRVYPKDPPEVLEKKKIEHEKKLDETFINQLIDNKLKSFYEIESKKKQDRDDKEKRRQELKEDIKEALKKDVSEPEKEVEKKLVEKKKRVYPKKPKAENPIQEVKPVKQVVQDDYFTQLIKSYK